MQHRHYIILFVWPEGIRIVLCSIYKRQFKRKWERSSLIYPQTHLESIIILDRNRSYLSELQLRRNLAYKTLGVLTYYTLLFVNVTNYPVRNRNDYTVPRCRLSLYPSSFIPSVINLWNSLDNYDVILHIKHWVFYPQLRNDRDFSQYNFTFKVNFKGIKCSGISGVVV
jgi:hypothetical protein